MPDLTPTVEEKAFIEKRRAKGIRATTAVERCVLLRRRINMTQAELAEALGCCRYWVILMEQGKRDPKRLLDYWG